LLGRAGSDGEELAPGSAWVGAGSLRVVTTGSAAGDCIVGAVLLLGLFGRSRQGGR
jgi:hypothetical protein